MKNHGFHMSVRNVLIYPISDECHDYRGDLAAFNNKIRQEIVGDRLTGIRGVLDDLLRRLRRVGVSDEWHLVFDKSFEHSLFGLVSWHF